MKHCKSIYIYIHTFLVSVMITDPCCAVDVFRFNSLALRHGDDIGLVKHTCGMHMVCRQLV